MRVTRWISIAVLGACGGGLDLDERAVCGEPPATAVPIALADSGDPLHWRVSPCIDVTYEGLTPSQVDELAAAVDAWTGFACSSVCFTRPVAAPRPADARYDGRIHAVASTPFTGRPAMSRLDYIASSARIHSATIQLAPTATRGDIVRHIGLSLGLGEPAAGVDSVLAPDHTLGTDTAPTARDGEALCALYGRPPLCE